MARSTTAQELRGILDQIDSLLLLVEEDGSLRYWNEPSARRFGNAHHSPVGGPFYALIHPEDLPATKRSLEQVFRGTPLPGDTDFGEIKFRMKGWEDAWVNCLAKPRMLPRREDARPLCVLVLREDRERRRGGEPLWDRVQELIEEVKAKSRKLAESEAEYLRLIETMNDGFWVLDLEGRIRFANEKLVRLLGYETSELVNMEAAELLDKENRDILRKQIRRRSQGKVGTYEIRVNRKDGKEITCLMRGAPRYDMEGRFAGSIGNITDISRRKELEDRLRASEKDFRDLFENMQDVVFRMDRAGRILAINRAGAQILGFDRAGDLIGTTLARLFEEGSEYGLFQTDLEERGFLEDRIVHLLRKDGKVATMSVNAHVFLDEQGWPAGVDGVFRDVSERARMEHRLQGYAKDLERKNEELESLIYSITHDLKSPLLVVGGMVNRLEKATDGVLSSKGNEYLDWIRSNVSKMETMVKDLLLFYRADKAFIPFETVSVGSLVDTVLRDIEPLARDKGVRLRKNGPFPVVEGYRNRLYQALYNLVENAVKYTDQKKDATVEVGCTIGDGEHEFRVRDNGPGIAPEHHEKIFQIFYTLEPKMGSGTGVGLSIVKKIVEKHGGRIWVESEPGRGSSFCFTLPGGPGSARP